MKKTIEEIAKHSSEMQEATYTPQHKITYKHGFIDGAKYQSEQMQEENEKFKAEIKQLRDFINWKFSRMV